MPKVKLKSDDVIFLVGGTLLVLLILIKVEHTYVATIAGFFGGHKIGSIVDDKFVDRNRSEASPRYDAKGNVIE